MRIRVTRWSGPYSTRLPPHRWRTRRGLTVDLVLIDEVRLRRGVVEWSNGVRLDLAGIEFAMRDAAAVGFGMPDNVYVASLRALFLCKVTAWLDRPGDRRKDLLDLAQILDRYVEHDVPRCSAPVVPADMDIAERPTFLLGFDLRVVASADRDRLARFLDEVSDEDQAPHAMLAANWPRDGEALPRRLAALRVGLTAGGA
jgi:predicted nucleotidyltransferase